MRGRVETAEPLRTGPDVLDDAIGIPGPRIEIVATPQRLDAQRVVLQSIGTSLQRLFDDEPQQTT